MLGGELGCRLGVDLQPEEVANHLDVLEPGAGALDPPLLLRDAEVPGLAGLPDLELVGPDHLFGLLLELLYAAPAELYLGGELRRSEEHTSELQSRQYLVCRLLLEKKKKTIT